jgi:hypothetical protein
VSIPDNVLTLAIASAPLVLLSNTKDKACAGSLKIAIIKGATLFAVVSFV